MVAFVALALSACVTVDEDGKSTAQPNDKQATVYAQLAERYMVQNQMDVALREAETALSLDSRNAYANDVMARIQVRLRNNDKAETHYRRAVSADPSSGIIRNNFGTFLCDQGRIDDAVDEFLVAAKNPLYASPDIAFSNAAVCLMKKPDPKKAAIHFKAALEKNPRMPLPLYYMALISFESGQPLAARGFMSRYLEVAKDSPAVLLLAIRIERALGAKDAMASYSVRLRGKYPDSPEAKQLRQLVGPK
jgi:type IV pilus assembly protein PilF